MESTRAKYLWLRYLSARLTGGEGSALESAPSALLGIVELVDLRNSHRI